LQCFPEARQVQEPKLLERARAQGDEVRQVLSYLEGTAPKGPKGVRDFRRITPAETLISPAC
jgi:hypothetical protein